MLSTLLEVAGLVCIIAAAFWVAVPLGLVVLGLSLLAVGLAGERA